LGAFERCSLEIRVSQDDKFPLGILVPFYDFVPWDGLAFRLADALVFDGRQTGWRSSTPPEC
jgi:hypothetical protein